MRCKCRCLPPPIGTPGPLLETFPTSDIRHGALHLLPWGYFSCHGPALHLTLMRAEAPPPAASSHAFIPALIVSMQTLTNHDLMLLLHGAPCAFFMALCLCIEVWVLVIHCLHYLAELIHAPVIRRDSSFTFTSLSQAGPGPRFCDALCLPHQQFVVIRSGERNAAGAP